MGAVDQLRFCAIILHPRSRAMLPSKLSAKKTIKHVVSLRVCAGRVNRSHLAVQLRHVSPVKLDLSANRDMNGVEERSPAECAVILYFQRTEL